MITGSCNFGWTSLDKFVHMQNWEQSSDMNHEKSENKLLAATWRRPNDVTLTMSSYSCNGGEFILCCLLFIHTFKISQFHWCIFHSNCVELFPLYVTLPIQCNSSFLLVKILTPIGSKWLQNHLAFLKPKSIFLVDFVTRICKWIECTRCSTRWNNFVMQSFFQNNFCRFVLNYL